MNSIAALKTVNDEFEVEYEILSPIDIPSIASLERQEIATELQNIDAQVSLCEGEIAKISTEINRLTNQADGLDYTVAVASGILTGLIDSFFVGKVDLAECRQWGSDKINDFVKKVGGDEDLKKAISNLEKNQNHILLVTLI